jgi:S-DNA-T family DNA segregation ATPase FtsK/SpoIIIE
MAATTAVRRRRNRTTKKSSANTLQTREIAGLGLVAVGVFLAITLFVGISVGPVGSGLETLVRLIAGRGVALAPLLLVALGVAIIFNHTLLDRPPFRIGLAALTAATLLALAAGSMGLGGPTRTSFFASEVMQGRGGLVGELLYYATFHTVGAVGTAIVVVLGIIVGAVLITGASLSVALRRSGSTAAVAGRAVGRSARTVTQGAVRGTQRIGEQVRTRLVTRDEPTTVMPRRVGGAEPPLDGADQFPDLFSAPGMLPRSPALGPDEHTESHAEMAAAIAPSPAPAAEDPPGADDDTGEVAAVALATLIPPSNPMKAGFRTPSLNILKRSSGPTTQPAAVIGETSRRLVETLGHFGIQAEVSDAVSGPRVTRYELQLAPGTKVSRVSALRDDLAYALAAREEIRIIAPIPGKQAVGVEVANQNATLVTLGDIFRDFPEGAGPLMSWLGIDIGGSAVYLDLARMPHILIAGSTGTGKSVCLNAILASILLRATPDDLRMILIDPKKVELNHYEGIPHLLTPVVTNMKNASAVLHNVVREMESRYELMGQDRARNLRDWNATRVSRGDNPIATILVVIDELADLMMVAPAEVEDSIIRLAQKSRAVGIHLVLATQRPSVDVITGMIKANVPSRIAFAVSSQIDSRVILDATGAESLLGQGDMLFRPIGTSRLQRLQGAFVTEQEILAVTDHWRRQGRPELREDLLERPEVPEEDPLDPDADDLIEKAVEMVVSQGTASVSLLQRRLGVGYARAGRLVDMMERMGVISGHEGSKPRTVLIGEGDLDRVLRRSSPEEPDEQDRTSPDDPVLY